MFELNSIQYQVIYEEGISLLKDFWVTLEKVGVRTEFTQMSNKKAITKMKNMYSDYIREYPDHTELEILEINNFQTMEDFFIDVRDRGWDLNTTLLKFGPCAGLKVENQNIFKEESIYLSFLALKFRIKEKDIPLVFGNFDT